MGNIYSSQDLFPKAGELPFTVIPKTDESLIGFLIRAADIHCVNSLSDVLMMVTGKPLGIPGIKSIEQMSDCFGLPINRLLGLFGLIKHYRLGCETLFIHNQWISSSRYVSSRKLSICPRCLIEDAYLKSIWELTYYNACADHALAMITHCPGCKRRIPWNRKKICYCSCGFDLRNTPQKIASDDLIFISNLIALNLGYKAFYQPKLLMPGKIENVLQLISLQELMDLIWFFGECLPRSITAHPARGRDKHLRNGTEQIVKTALSLLRGWPLSFKQQIELYLDQLRQKNRLISRGPVQSFLFNQNRTENCYFITVAYQHYFRDYLTLQKTWFKVERSTFKQLEMEL